MGADDSNSSKFTMTDETGQTQTYDKNPSYLTRQYEGATQSAQQLSRVYQYRKAKGYDAGPDPSDYGSGTTGSQE